MLMVRGVGSLSRRLSEKRLGDGPWGGPGPEVNLPESSRFGSCLYGFEAVLAV